MSAPQLQLFKQSAPVSREQIATPATVQDKGERTDPRPVGLTRTQYRSITSALGKIFPTSQELSRVQQARRIMVDEIKELSDENLEECLTEFQFLIDSWFDEFELAAYDGKTLREVAKEV